VTQLNTLENRSHGVGQRTLPFVSDPIARDLWLSTRREARERARSAIAVFLDCEADDPAQIVETLTDDSLREIINATTENDTVITAQRIAVELCAVKLDLLREQLDDRRFSRPFYELATKLHIEHASKRLKSAKRFAKVTNNPFDFLELFNGRRMRFGDVQAT
jgi:hypothetical protein